MTTVEAHELKFPDPEGELAMVERQIEKAPQKITKVPRNVGVCFDRSLRMLGFRAFLQRPNEDLLKALHAARDFSVGLFRRGSASPDETVRFIVKADPIEIPGGTSEFNTAPRWVKAFGVALVLRDEAAQDSLCEYNPVDFEGSYDHHHIALACALMAMHTGSQEAEACFREAQEQADSAPLFPERGKRVSAPLARLAHAVHRRMVDELEPLLVEALEGYRALYSRRNDSHLAEAYLPVAHLGLSALAHDRDLPVTVQSPYLPRWLVEGAFA